MFVHPMNMRPERCLNWHFKMPEASVDAAEATPEANNDLNEDEAAGLDKSEYNLGTLESEGDHPSKP